MLRPNEVVSSDRLIDELWGERPPATAAKTLQVMVSALRKRPEPERGRGEPGRVLLTRSPGYLFRVEAEQLDLACFERLCGEGREAFAAGDSAVAARELRDALALWRGPPLADLAYEPCVQSQIAWLGELRLAAVEDRLEADLDGMGRRRCRRGG